MTTRKDFIAAGAMLGALAPQIALADATPAATPTPIPLPHLDFELAAFDASLAKPAKHKNLFTSRKLEDCEVFGAIEGTIFAYDAIGTPLADVSIAGVLYHGVSVFYAFDDSIWHKYLVPYIANVKKDSPLYADLQSVNAHNGNPCLHKTGAADDQSIETLIAQVGMRLYACNRAVGGMARSIAHEARLDPRDVYKELAAHLVANAMLVPSGVWGVHAVEERGFTLLQVN